MTIRWQVHDTADCSTSCTTHPSAPRCAPAFTKSNLGPGACKTQHARLIDG